MLSLGMLCAFAFSIARRSRGFDAGSPPPVRAAIVISRMSFVKILPRFASWAPLRNRMLAHLLWPAIALLAKPHHGSSGHAPQRSVQLPRNRFFPVGAAPKPAPAPIIAAFLPRMAPAANRRHPPLYSFGRSAPR